MRIEYAPATGCPYGQLVVHADSAQERAILHMFLQPVRAPDRNPGWLFHIHGWSWRTDDGGDGPYSFNFGYVEARKWRRTWRQRFAQWRRGY